MSRDRPTWREIAGEIFWRLFGGVVLALLVTYPLLCADYQ